MPLVPGIPGEHTFGRKMPSHTPESELRTNWLLSAAEVKPTTAAGGGLRANLGLAARK